MTYPFPISCVISLAIFFGIAYILASLLGYLLEKIPEHNKIINYQQAKQRMISALKKSVEAQNAGQLEKIEDGYDDLDMALPRKAGPEFGKLLNALYFWDCWIDAYNHGWQQYRDMHAEDWLRLAGLIIADLEADQEIIHHLKKILREA